MTVTELARAPVATEALFNAYHVGWETRNPDLIASLHSADTVFHMHDGSEPVLGREALCHACQVMFDTYHFTFEMGRRLFGERHWVFEWLMVLDLKDTTGVPFTAKVEMLDIVTLNDNDEVARKDVYMNGRQAQEAFTRAGIVR
jgi:SnoaL-like domain